MTEEKYTQGIGYLEAHTSDIDTLYYATIDGLLFESRSASGKIFYKKRGYLIKALEEATFNHRDSKEIVERAILEGKIEIKTVDI